MNIVVTSDVEYAHGSSRLCLQGGGYSSEFTLLATFLGAFEELELPG